MEYEYLIGHRVKVNYFNGYLNKKIEKIGIVSKVLKIERDKETIYMIGNECDYWFKPLSNHIIDLKIEILDEIKYTKFTRFEIMEI